MSVRAVFAPAMVYALTGAAGAAVPVLILPIMTRVLSPEEYGLVAMFSVMVTIFGTIAGLSVHGAVGVKYFQRERFDLALYVTTCLIILGASVALTALVIWPASPWLERITKLPAQWLLVGVLVAGCQFVIQIRLVIWQSAALPWRYGALRIVQALVDAGISLLLVVTLGLGWQGRAAGISLALLITATIALVTLDKGGWLARRGDRRYAADALRFGVPLIPHGLGWILISMVDRFMISNLIDVHSTGIYTVALQIGMVLWMLIEAFNKAYSVWLMRSLGERNAERDRHVVQFTYFCFLAMLAAALALGVAAPVFLPLIAGPEFLAAGPIVVYIAIGQAFTGMYTFVAQYIFFAGRTPYLALISAVGGAINISLSYWLLLHHGVIGAAQAFVVSQMFIFAATWWAAHRAHPMPWLSALRANVV